MYSGLPRPNRPATTNDRRSGTAWPGLVVFLALVWLAIVCLEPVATLEWLGPVPRHNLELGIDARALFYTEIDIDTATPVIGMMPKTKDMDER